MIVPMKHMTLLCVAAEREATLERLRELGAVHLELGGAADSDACRHAQNRLATARHAQQILKDALAGKPVIPTVSGPHKAHGHEGGSAHPLSAPLPEIAGDAEAHIAAICQLADLRQALANEAERLAREIARVTPFGSFDTALPARLAAQGVPVRLFSAPAAAVLTPGEGAMIHTLSADAHTVWGVMIGPGDLPEGCVPAALPETPLDLLREQHEAARARIGQITERLCHAARHAGSVQAETDRLSELSLFATAAAAMQSAGAVVWITGWLPADQEAELRETARENAWGLLARDPAAGETPPTLLRPPRLFRPVLTLFEGLGISPAYTETDISVPFFCFFSIFFAMLVGDGGYGALILALTFYARRKLPTAPRAPFVLLTCFAAATIMWGALSNTWFGAHPGFADNAASRWLNHPENGINNMMLFCFTLGVIHLSLARLWNAAALFPDTKALAQIGWVGVVVFMYCMSCGIVGIFKAPAFVYPLFAVSVLLIFLFTLKRDELKTNGIELGMLPLNIVSALGDIISYVRLFAVGLASVKVAENFNDMAINLGLPLWAKIVPMILILLVGHGLNFAMAGLSILVHAVRLNTLEFSNHKGITWAGYAFKPFKRL
ncbi:MAG: hypothetical protein PHX41_01480 [Kiritimatiellae bacterium]|nr:hypothetical protein [Kiritimatiellia bacterium]